MSPEVMSSIITSVISVIIGLLLGRWGIMRNISSLVDSKVQKLNTESQIALTREQTDMQTVSSLTTQLASLTDLLRTQLIQEAQRATESTTAQNNLATSQNNLTGKINEFIEEFRASQRSANNRVDDVLRSYEQDIKTIETGYRTIADGFLLSNSATTRILQKWDTNMDDVRTMFTTIREDISTLRSESKSSNDYVGEVLEIAITMRNTIFKLTGQSDDKQIRSPFDTHPIPVPHDLLFKHHELKPNLTEPEEPKPVEPVAKPIEEVNVNLPEEKSHETPT